MVAGRRRIVPSPPVVPPRFGLYSAASIVDETVAEGRTGSRFQPEACGQATSYGDSCPAVDERTKTVEQGIPEALADSFVVYAGINCSPVGWAPDEMATRARNALTNGEGRAVEASFWTGDLDNGETIRPRLAEDEAGTPGEAGVPEARGPLATVLGGGPVGVGLGLALLEEAIGSCYAGRPILHMPRSVALLAAGANLAARDGANLATPLGSLVAAGFGYDGSGPGGAAPTSTATRWVYASGAVVIRRWPIEAIPPIAQTLDRGVNTNLVLAERVVEVSFDCCLFAVEVDLTDLQGGLP